MEDESFELLSSMSPKVKHCQKHFRKGTTVLALRKSIRRSSIYDKSVHTVNNDELIITETSSGPESTSSSNLSNNCKKLLNKTPIIIHDSDSDCNEPRFNSNKKELPTEKGTDVNMRQSLLSEDKLEDIKQWIDNIKQSIVKDSGNYSAYSELSTIYGDDSSKNFIIKKTEQAINSTIIGPVPIHFNELFKQKTDYVPFKTKEMEQEIIDDSYVEQGSSSSKPPSKKEVSNFRKDKFISNSDESAKTSSDGMGSEQNNYWTTNSEKSLNVGSISINSNAENDGDDSFSLNESLNTRLKNKDTTDRNSEKNYVSSTKSNELNSSVKNSKEAAENVDLASMLDDLYGNEWRKKEEHVLPKTEPRKRVTNLNNIRNLNSERKPKLSVLYKNPYLEIEKSKSVKLLENLQKSRLKNYMESPTVKRLNDVCDSDTDSDNMPNPKAKLNFNDSDFDICKRTDSFHNTINGDRTKSKFFKEINKVSSKHKAPDDQSDKENLDDFSCLGQTLEERIRKKINGIKNLPNKTKKNGKNSSENKVPTIRGPDSNKIDKKTNSNVNKEKTDNRKLSRSSSSSTSSGDVWEKEISKIIHETKPINGKFSFLASLSANIPILKCDMSARIYRNNFKSYKDQLLKKLFTLYNERIFENAIPQNTALEWNDRMRGTAGFCYCKKITRKIGTIERTARIVLSTKVIDEAHRLRDTLIHEMCHAATWIVNCVSDGHGPYWKSWAYKAMKTFPELPPIKRCHDYVINTKYTYKCKGCGYSIGRHSKSLDIERKRCGYCLGKFEVLLNKVSKKGETKSVPATPKKEATGFALFVKENYSVYKQVNLKHGDVMKLLGQKFQETKLKPS